MKCLYHRILPTEARLRRAFVVSGEVTMPLPAHASTVTLTGRWINPATGAAASGSVTFTPSTTLAVGTDGSFLVPATLAATLDANGAISATLLATDDTDISPTGWYYTVVENITGVTTRSYTIQLPAAQSPVDLSTIAPLTTPPTLVAYLAASARGAASGVASLDSSTLIPVAQLPSIPASLLPTATVEGWTSPNDHGFIAWSHDPSLLTTGTAPTSGVLQIIRFILRKTQPVTRLHTYSTSAGTVPTNVGGVLADSAGNIVGSASIVPATWNTAGMQTFTFTPQSMAAGVVYGAFWANGGTTPVLRAANLAAASHNMNLSAAAARFATGVTGLTSTPPATLGTLALGAPAYWAALS